MDALWTITAKDLKLRFRDRSVLLYGVVAPLVLAFVLGGVFGGLQDRITLDLGVVADADRQLAGPFLEDVLPALAADGLVEEVTEFATVDQARAAVEAGELTAAVVFTDGDATGPGDIEVLGNVDSPTGTGVTEAIVEGYADGVRSAVLAVGAGVAAGAQDPAALVAAARDATSAVSMVDEPVGLEPIDLTTYMAAGMSVFFLLFAVGIAVTGLLEEERDGTMARLVTAPIPTWAPLGAKALTAVVVGTGSMTALAVATTVLIGADWGHPLGVALLIVTAVLAATGVVALVASFARTPESASGALGVVGTVMGALGGAFFPLRDVGLLEAVSAATPHHWFLRGLTRLAGGAPPGDVVGPSLVLVAIGAVTAALAVVRLQRSQEA